METKDRIICKSIELFTQWGIRFVTMNQIAGETGISKRTLYEVFKDKDDLLKQCIEQMAEQNAIEMEKIINASDNTIEALYLIGQHGERKKSTVNRLFFEDMDKLYPHLKKLFMKRSDKEETITFKILKKGINEGIFRKEIDLRIVDTFIHEMMRICHNSELFANDTNNSELVENIVIPYFRGISTQTGQDLLEKHFPTSK